MWIDNIPAIMTTSDTQDDGDDDREHLQDLRDGCGCAEIWEHLSERRAEDRADAPSVGGE